MSNEFAVLDLDGKPMAFTTLPYEMHLKILSYLSAKDLCNYERVCKEFRCHYAVMNEVWWKLCMAEWWIKGDRPKYMSKADKKKSWKESFSRITPHAAKDLPKTPFRPILAVIKDQPELPPPPEFSSTQYKVDMRAFYKSIRSKPKGKGTELRGSKQVNVFADD